jgi:uncharacterized paraquat-inducible protein A
MSFGARLILLSQQIRSNKFKQCSRCALFHDRSQEYCPHCTGLSDRQDEELIENKKKELQTGSVLYLVFIFSALILLFAVMQWLFE